MELVHRKIIAGFWPHSNLSPVVGGSPCGGDRPGTVVTPTLKQRQRRRRIVIDEREDTRGGGEWIVIDDRGIAPFLHQDRTQLCHANFNLSGSIGTIISLAYIFSDSWEGLRFGRDQVVLQHG